MMGDLKFFRRLQIIGDANGASAQVIPAGILHDHRQQRSSLEADRLLNALQILDQLFKGILQRILGICFIAK